MAILTLTQRQGRYGALTASTDKRRLRKNASFTRPSPLRMRGAPTQPRMSYTSSLTARQIPCYRKPTSAYVCAYASVSLMYVPMYLSILLSSVTAVNTTVNIISKAPRLYIKASSSMHSLLSDFLLLIQ